MQNKKKAKKEAKRNTEQNDRRVILHDIRSTHNVGSIFRTADAVGVSRIYVSGYTPAPTDRFGRVQKDIAKTALGAEKSVPWEKVEEKLEEEVEEKTLTLSKLITSLKKQGFTIVAIEQGKESVDYTKVKLPSKAVFIVGNEVTGIAPAILKKCDIIAEIPMRGAKESLNVSVAFGVALFRMM